MNDAVWWSESVDIQVGRHIIVLNGEEGEMMEHIQTNMNDVKPKIVYLTRVMSTVDSGCIFRCVAGQTGLPLFLRVIEHALGQVVEQSWFRALCPSVSENMG